MKERPILFSASMVRAILDGSKTQTRRVIKLPDSPMTYAKSDWMIACEPIGRCPYGKPGDHLWVREAFWAFGKWEQRYSEKKQRKEWCFIDMTLERDRLYQYQDPSPGKFRHRRDIDLAWWPRNSIYMPRIASRIQLEINAIRIERLQDISEEDAIAEGVTFEPTHPRHQQHMGKDAYQRLWETINGEGSWDANPWVWVVEFKVIK